MIYTLNNPTEEPLDNDWLTEQAVSKFTANRTDEIHTTFIVKQDVFIITYSGDIYQSSTLSRNEARFNFYGEIESLSEIDKLKNALEVIYAVTTRI